MSQPPPRFRIPGRSGNLTRTSCCLSSACTILFLRAALPALAQTRSFDVAVGPSVLSEVHTGGAQAGVTGSFTSSGDRRVGIAGEVTGSDRVLWLLVGPRISSGLPGFRPAVFVHVLLGTALADGEPYFVFQPGGGVDVRIRQSINRPHSTATVAQHLHRSPQHLSEAPSTLGEGRSTFSEAPSTLSEGRSTFSEGRSTFSEAPSTLGEGRSTLSEVSRNRARRSRCRRRAFPGPPRRGPPPRRPGFAERLRPRGTVLR